MILSLIYFFLPAYVANMVPVLARNIPFNYPMDFGLKLWGVRILGSHKTWRGFILGVLIGGITFIIQNDLRMRELEIVPYSSLPIYFGFVMAGGALIGDALKSFFKRRAGIGPGNPWVPFDQVDLVLGGLAAPYFWYFPGLMESTVLLVITFFGHITINHLAYWTGVRNEKW